MSLSANQLRAEMKPLPAWKIKGEPQQVGERKRGLAPAIGDGLWVMINPFDIRTYTMQLTLP
jgi:hypothetical protein